MLNAYFSLVNDLPGIFDSAHHTPRVVIAIDEAHMLSKKNTFQPLAISCRAISTYSRSWLTSYPIWVVFASTTSRVPADFAFPHYHCEFPPATLSVSLLWILGRSLFSSFPERTMQKGGGLHREGVACRKEEGRDLQDNLSSLASYFILVCTCRITTRYQQVGNGLVEWYSPSVVWQATEGTMVL